MKTPKKVLWVGRYDSMNLWQAVVLGIIQGITEWLPVSSSGHLVLGKHFLGLEPSLAFDVFLHFGSAAVVLLIFRKEVITVITVFVNALDDLPSVGIKAFTTTPERRLGVLIILACIPTGIIGLIVSHYYEGVLSEPRTVGIALLVTSVLLAMCRNRRGTRGTRDLNSLDALVVGTLQGIATIPGISRSGSTISGGILRGINRQVAVRYSFLLFLPAILGSGLLKARHLSGGEELLPLTVGVITAMVVGYFTIKALLKVVEKGWFHYFAIYCGALGLILLFMVG